MDPNLRKLINPIVTRATRSAGIKDRETIREILAQVRLGEMTPEYAVLQLVSHKIDIGLADAYVRQASAPFAMAIAGRHKSTSDVISSILNKMSMEEDELPDRFMKEPDRYPVWKKLIGYLGDKIVAELANVCGRSFTDWEENEEIRYGLAPYGSHAIFEEKTTGGGMLYRVRGVYLEEEFLEEFYDQPIIVIQALPFLIAHEVNHDFFGLSDDRNPFEYELNEMKIDSKGIETLLATNHEVFFGFPKQLTQENRIALSYLSFIKIVLQRHSSWKKEGRLKEIVGEDFVIKKPYQFLRFITISASLLDLKLNPQIRNHLIELIVELKNLDEVKSKKNEYETELNKYLSLTGFNATRQKKLMDEVQKAARGVEIYL